MKFIIGFRFSSFLDFYLNYCAPNGVSMAPNGIQYVLWNLKSFSVSLRWWIISFFFSFRGFLILAAFFASLSLLFYRNPIFFFITEEELKQFYWITCWLNSNMCAVGHLFVSTHSWFVLTHKHWNAALVLSHTHHTISWIRRSADTTHINLIFNKIQNNIRRCLNKYIVLYLCLCSRKTY